MTPRQKRVLDFVTRQIRRTGVSPSYDEISAEIGAKSRSAGYRYVSILVRDGYLLRTPACARSIRLAPTHDSKPASHDVMAAAEQVLEAIVFENDRTGITTVSAAAIGALDVAVAERRAELAARAS